VLSPTGGFPYDLACGFPLDLSVMHDTTRHTAHPSAHDSGHHSDSGGPSGSSKPVVLGIAAAAAGQAIAGLL
jgi:hypothetical protein